MRAGILFLLLFGALALVAILSRPDPPAVAEPKREQAAFEPSPEWTGSKVCGSCHYELYERWSRTGHAKSMMAFSPGVVARPFDGEVFTARDIDHRLGPGPEMYCEGPGGDMQTFQVDFVMGIRRIQMFLTNMDRGRIQVLPVMLEVPKKRWFDYTDFIFGAPPDLEVPPDSANSWYHYARNFNSRCGSCHSTNFDIGYDADRGAYASTWSERVIGCEGCHGPGGAHVDMWRRLELGDTDPIVNPVRYSIQRANEVCGFCHSESEIVVPGWRPGDDLFSFVDINGLEDEKHCSPDGRANELFHNLVPIMESGCGPIACTKCHDAHGRGIPGDVYRPVDDDWFCTQCHSDYAVKIEEHTKHKADGPGSRCIACHMPRLVIEGGHGRVYDHTISIPSGRNTQRYGLPNACRDCHYHLLQDTGWEYESIERLWPGCEERNHRVKLADAMAGGRERKPEAKGPLLELLKSGNLVYRAGAAWALASYDGVDLREQLAKSEHAMVRRAAIKGVALRHPEALIPLLEDENAVLRRAAAVALARKYDYIRGKRELLEKLRATLVPFSRLRPDNSGLHISVGAVHELLGDKAEAIRSYERSLSINPNHESLKSHVERLK